LLPHRLISSALMKVCACGPHQVSEMQQQLQDLQPELIQTSEETKKLMVKIEKDTVEAEAKKEVHYCYCRRMFRSQGVFNTLHFFVLLQVVAADEAVANEAAAKAQSIKDDCESDLAEAIPALESALSALDTLKPSDITLVKTMKVSKNAAKIFELG